MAEPTWDEFLVYLYELPSRLRPGRQRIRVVRDNLQALVDEYILPALTPDDELALFPLGYSPSESDLKIAAGVGLERGLISSTQYEQALRMDKAAGPFGFLQTYSGKTFGETVAPLIAQYWLKRESDRFVKVSNRGLYDFGWTPAETDTEIRIEMKASSEASPNFQQIRHPRMTDQSASGYEYDVLLCLGLSNEGLEWWVFPAAHVATAIDTEVFIPQHGGRKAVSGTYWVRLDARGREQFKDYQADTASLRNQIIAAAAGR